MSKKKRGLAKNNSDGCLCKNRALSIQVNKNILAEVFEGSQESANSPGPLENKEQPAFVNKENKSHLEAAGESCRYLKGHSGYFSEEATLAPSSILATTREEKAAASRVKASHIFGLRMEPETPPALQSGLPVHPDSSTAERQNGIATSIPGPPALQKLPLRMPSILPELFESRIVQGQEPEGPLQPNDKQLFSNTTDENVESGVRQRRASSMKAQQKIVELRNKEDMETKALQEATVQSQSVFCGIPIRRRISLPGFSKTINGCSGDAGQLIQLLGPGRERGVILAPGTSETVASSPVHRHLISPSVLADSTNAARSSPRLKKEVDSAACHSKFFLDDLLFLKEKKGSSKRKKSLHVKEDRTKKRYIKQKRRNTQKNSGYKTVSLRKKAVIDLYSCPRTTFRSTKRDVLVRFDLKSSVSVHNNDAAHVPPILVASGDTPEFTWDSGKEIVDVVRRLDFGSEISVEDFIFRRVDKSIES